MRSFCLSSTAQILQYHILYLYLLTFSSSMAANRSLMSLKSRYQLINMHMSMVWKITPANKNPHCHRRCTQLWHPCSAFPATKNHLLCVSDCPCMLTGKLVVIHWPTNLRKQSPLTWSQLTLSSSIHRFLCSVYEIKHKFLSESAQRKKEKLKSSVSWTLMCWLLSAATSVSYNVVRGI